MRRINILFILFTLSILTGCGAGLRQPPGQGMEDTIDQFEQEIHKDVSPEFVKYCGSIYKQSVANKTLGSIEMIEEMVGRLGGQGYTVVDQYNQTDMENPELLKDFCRKVEEKQHAKQALLVVLHNGGLVQFEFQTADGRVDIWANSWMWQNNQLIHQGSDHFQAYAWVYSEEGYLFFEKYYMEGFSGPYSHTAVRIAPLDGSCREMNRKYIWPVGYGGNNLFISNWNEDDYLGLDFYDLFDLLYPLKNTAYCQDLSDCEGPPFQIPDEKFEKTIQAYFQIDAQELREKTKYREGSKTYEYRPRGMYDSGSGAETPYPEVVGCKAEGDGTVKLLVNAVWPERNLEAAFRHEVVIRPLADGSYQYVSNCLIPSEHNEEPVWYVPRLSEEAWHEYYGMHPEE